MHLGAPVGNTAGTFLSPFSILKPQSILHAMWWGITSFPGLGGVQDLSLWQLRGRILQGGHWREAQLKLADFVGVTLYGNGNCFFPRAGQIPIISLLGASLEPSSQTAPLQAFFPEPRESPVPRLGARGHSWGSTPCPFGTGAFLRSSISQETELFKELHAALLTNPTWLGDPCQLPFPQPLPNPV